jgi:hypothetical protein
MKLVRTKDVAGLLAAACCAVSLPADAVINGYYDAVYLQMTDTANGWICESTAPGIAPPGDLVVYTGGPAGGGGTLYIATSVSNAWNHSRPDVPLAGYCGTNQNTGWELVGWFDGITYVYYRDTGGGLQLLQGSPKNCSGPGWCY